MRFGSLFSGLEAASLAFSPLGWKAEWVSEIDPVACSLLRQRVPHAPNLGDITKAKDFEDVELVIGGSPCQSFSVNADGDGLDDPRGQLALEFVRVAGACRPRWVVWENVVGALRRNGGRDFAAIVGALGKLGYCYSWRVLDARAFGVPQSRRRVFVVGHLGDWRAAAGVLLEPGAGGQDDGALPQPRKRAAGPACWGWTGDATPKFMPDTLPTMRSGQGGEGTGVVSRDGRIRRLTATELERAIGVPDGWTDVEHEGKPLSYRQRQRLLGNTFPPPMVGWIGARVAAWEGMRCA